MASDAPGGQAVQSPVSSCCLLTLFFQQTADCCHFLMNVNPLVLETCVHMVLPCAPVTSLAL